MTPAPPQWTYRVFGLTVSSDSAIEGVVPITQATIADVRIRTGSGPVTGLRETSPDHISSYVDEAGRPLATVYADDTWLQFVLSTGASYVLNRQGSEIWVDAGATSNADVSEVLLSPMLAMTLRHRGVVCLHASAVTFGQDAVLFIGTERAGKSSLAAACVLQGARLITDDVAALAWSPATGQLGVHVGPPYIRARPGAVDRVASQWAGNVGPASTGDWIDLDARDHASSIEEGPLPISTIFVLEPSPSQELSLHGAEAVVRLLAHTWPTRWLTRALRVRELATLEHLVEQASIQYLPRRSDADLVRTVLDAVGARLVPPRGCDDT